MAEQVFYVLKVKGKAKIPDYIQVRDADFTLIGYFRPGRAKKRRGEASEQEQLFERIEELSEDLPFGQISKVALSV